jgi:hypothetical protein
MLMMLVISPPPLVRIVPTAMLMPMPIITPSSVPTSRARSGKRRRPRLGLEAQAGGRREVSLWRNHRAVHLLLRLKRRLLLLLLLLYVGFERQQLYLQYFAI